MFPWLLGLGGCFTQAGDWPHTSNTGKNGVGPKLVYLRFGGVVACSGGDTHQNAAWGEPKKNCKDWYFGVNFFAQQPTSGYEDFKVDLGTSKSTFPFIAGQVVLPTTSPHVPRSLR